MSKDHTEEDKNRTEAWKVSQQIKSNNGPKRNTRKSKS
jgi:hypothetical protein